MNENKKKKILWLGDDIRFFSGIATMSREIIFGTLKKYDYACLGGATQHPEYGKMIDMSSAAAKETGITDAYVHIYPTNGYGNDEILTAVMNVEKPDAICMITDPRYYGWLFLLERKIRQKIPICYYHIWDDIPYPMWNRPFYQSCDNLMAISKQSNNIAKWVIRPEFCRTIDGEFDNNGKLIADNKGEN